jgi:hypothetical protein
MRALTLALVAIALPRVARADEPPPEPPAPAPPQATPPAPSPAELAARIEDLEDEHKELQKKLATEMRRNEKTRADVASLVSLQRFITVFVDVGAFAVAGDGSGIRSDIGHIYYPQYAGRVAAQWVFMGDPLSTTINSLGEPADTSDSRELKDDSLKSGGHPSLILNSLGLGIRKDVGHNFEVWGLAELLPRPGGDRLDVELAYIAYRPIEDVDLEISAGKINSVLGVEYRSQDAPRRLGVTPSLICRYTCGRPIGVEARLVHGRLSASGSITNGDFFDHRFEPELSIHANALPTGAAHLQWMLPVGQGLEVGVSGAVGPQTNQPDLDVLQWHVGFDARLRDLEGFDIAAEYVQGLQQGKTVSATPCDSAPCLDYKGAYLLVDRRVNPWLIPYVRVDWRDALHENGAQFIYESHVLRSTLGLHFEVTSRILAKVEYTFNRELDNIPQFPDDIVTTSFVVATD